MYANASQASKASRVLVLELDRGFRGTPDEKNDTLKHYTYYVGLLFQTHVKAADNE